MLSKRVSSQCPLLVIQAADTGIQVAYKQISIESGYNVFDEIAGTSVSYFHLPPANGNVRTVRYLDDTVERNEPPFQNCFE
ncbi:hypothetical protein [Wolbachia endosymbiont (group A) of Agelastica alni]|uniref:hypothetical protein n=1 Tax=Wolbachia endosymbiont (group A) of Agelastica alni TaxID=3066130 RepID=UPI003341227B